MRIKSSLLVLGLLLQAGFAGAQEAELSPGYLTGVWSLSGREACGTEDAQYVIFREYGTLEAGDSTGPTIVGFWEVVEDTIVAHTLRTPLKSTNDWHPFMRDSYRYEYVNARVVEIRPDEFVVELGSDLESRKRTETLTRCP